ncbi:MAG: ribonuclease E inhibitor RraB [Pirellula sp.]|jgi:hypothetical protein
MVNDETRRRKQSILENLLSEGDDLTLKHEVSWIYSFLSQEQAKKFRYHSELRMPSFRIELGDCQCTCTTNLVPDAEQLTAIEEEFDAISQQVAHRTECCASITSAVGLGSKG